MSASVRLALRHCLARRCQSTLATKPIVRPIVGGDEASTLDVRSRLARKAKWQRSSKGPVHADALQIHVKGGYGGDGCVAFAREMYKPYGPPSGGGGGNGGSVMIQAKSSVASLARLPSHLVSHRGTPGSGDWQPGRNALDKTLIVPVGTVVRVVPIRPEDSVDEASIHRARYERRLMNKYRSAYLRSRRMRRSSSVRVSKSNKDEQEYSPEELRLQRDAFWRHYAGDVIHHKREVKSKKGRGKGGENSEEEELANVDKRGETTEEESYDDVNEDRFYNMSEAEEVEEEVEVVGEVLEAESDIRDLGPTFQDSERRLAFALLGEQHRRGEQTENLDGEKLQDGQGWTVDLDRETDETIMLVRGGDGGFGNSFFASADNRSPTLATRGAPGEEAIVHLEWKFKGDVGLIGLPNAGKSTFLKAVSATGDDVRVAGYAFTTLNPNVGVVRLGEHGLLGVSNSGPIEESSARVHVAQRDNEEDDSNADIEDATATSASQFGNEESARFILQDLPGLVRGASYDRGLGHDFLKHIERCLALYYVLDVSEAAKTPWLDMRLVHDELEAYRSGLSRKVEGIIANKCDAIHVIEQQDQRTTSQTASVEGAGTHTAANIIDGRQKLQMLRQEAKVLHGRTIPVWNVSAKYRDGVERTARAMARVVARAKRVQSRNEEQ